MSVLGGTDAATDSLLYYGDFKRGFGKGTALAVPIRAPSMRL